MKLISAGERGGIERSRESDFAANLHKPVRSLQLMETLSDLCGVQTKGIGQDRTKRQSPAESFVEKKRHQPSNGLSHRIRLLVAEDNIVNQRVAVRMLEKLGCRVDVAANGREAVEMLERLPYDLVLMDCQMPEMDGYEATAAIRAREKSRANGPNTSPASRFSTHIPIIAMTANAMKGDREKCLGVGMDDYISKPVRSDGLVAMLEKWCPVDKPSQPGAPASDDPVPPPEPAEKSLPPALDAEFMGTLRELGGKDEPDFVEELSKQFIKDAAGQVETIRGAIAAGDAVILERTAHTLKSGCNAVGALNMGEICTELQALVREESVVGAGELAERLAGEYGRVCLALKEECSRGQTEADAS